MSDFSNDILLQIQERQMEDSRTLGTLLAKLDAHTERVAKLESNESRNWWMTVCIAPSLALGHGIARKLGVNI